MITITIPELPLGWHLDGIWHDGFEKDPTRCYAADASFPVSGDMPIKHIEVTTYGSTMQAALDGLSDECSRTIRAITACQEWLDAQSTGWDPSESGV